MRFFLVCATALLACSSDEPPFGSGGGGGEGGSVPVIEPFALPASTYSHGEPSQLEQHLLELLQRARKDPAVEGPRLVALPEVQHAIEQFSVDTAQLVADFATYPAAPPLAFHPLLSQAAFGHSTDMATNGFQGHTSTTGQSLGDRVTAVGYAFSSIAENVFAYADSVEHCHAALAIDWGPGNEDLGHRKTMLDLEKRKREIGISIVANPPHPDVGFMVVTQDFGLRDDAERYLVGVVYTDYDQSGGYGPNEGESGMLVVPENGGFYAVTSLSGGYAIPFPPGHGPNRVQLQTPDGVALEELQFDIADENVKVDFALPAP